MITNHSRPSLPHLVWYKGSVTLVGESPSSSASDVDNLNHQATIMDKTMFSKNITHLGNQVVARSQANFTRLLDFVSSYSLKHILILSGVCLDLS